MFGLIKLLLIGFILEIVGLLLLLETNIAEIGLILDNDFT
jgi:hypothetical protein